jgi:NACalpha-BTF3-like transcription factor
VVVKSEDIDVIAKELELPREKAELVLRENNGNLKEALRQLINA